MALIRLDHVPETTKVCQPLYMILPDPGQLHEKPLQERTVLYLLHGLSDDGSAWQRYTAIETYAYDHGLVVVMPSFARSFYTDQPNGQAYFSYLVYELPQYLYDVFHLKPARDKTIIAGVSMGGFGAMKAALNYPERYGAAASFSGALTLDILRAIPDDPRQAEFEYIFGPLDQLHGTEHDSMVWLQKAAENTDQLPNLLIACGRQDDLYPVNQMFYKACQSLGVPVDYHEVDGKHDWIFWDQQIKRLLGLVLGDPTG